MTTGDLNNVFTYFTTNVEGNNNINSFEVNKIASMDTL